MAPPDYGFLRRPLWLAGIALAFAAALAFGLLGFWQLGRLAEKRSFNELLAERRAVPATELAVLVDEAAGDPEKIRFRRAVVTGRFEPADEVLHAGRTYLGQPGYHVVTPLLTGDGTGVLIDRGWVPFDTDGPPVAGAPPPSGLVTVTGVVDTSPRGRSFGAPGDDGRVTRVGSIDLARLDAQIDAALVPVYLVLESTDADPAGPIADGPAPLSEGPHLGYAIQWFLFAIVVLVGFPILAYRTARDRSSAGPPRPR